MTDFMNESELHMSMPLDTRRVSDYVTEINFPEILECHCTMCGRWAVTTQTHRISVPPPYLVFYKVGAGEVRLDEHLQIMKVNALKISGEYLNISFLKHALCNEIMSKIYVEYSHRIFSLFYISMEYYPRIFLLMAHHSINGMLNIYNHIHLCGIFV